jgi:[acyl-carrier-protein] S-malonyltransferase
MRPAGDALVETLAATEFQIPAIEVLNSVDGSPYQGPDDIRERLRKQVFSPVRWVRTVQQMITDGASSLVECGPGKVLTGLAKRIDRSVPAACTDSPESLARALAAVNGAATTN